MKGKWKVPAFFYGLFFLMVGAVMYGLAPRTSDVTHLWRPSFREKTANHFWIPPESELVYAEERTEPIMGGGFLVRFILPNTKKPKEWLTEIAEKSELMAYKKSEWMFDAGDDVRRAEYIPEKRVFEVEWMWD